jgi:hypothetical protein
MYPPHYKLPVVEKMADIEIIQERCNVSGNQRKPTIEIIQFSYGLHHMYPCSFHFEPPLIRNLFQFNGIATESGVKERVRNEIVSIVFKLM